MDDNKTRISILWDVDLSKIPVSNRTTTIKNIKEETVEALNRISQVVNKKYHISSTNQSDLQEKDNDFQDNYSCCKYVTHL
jgi:hypothetical protein